MKPTKRRHQRKHRRWVVLGLVAASACVALAVITASMAGNRSERISLSGSVNQDGKPLENGRILFKPAPGTSAPMAGTNIKAGRYRFDSETGPKPGEYKVQITAGGPPRKSSMPPSKTRSPVHEFSREVSANSRELAFDLPP